MRKYIKRRNKTPMTGKRFQLVVIGGSMGSHDVISHILSSLPVEFVTPIIITRHIGSSYKEDFYLKLLNEKCSLTVKEADPLESISSRHVYFAPANYHLLVERDRTLSLSIDLPVLLCVPMTSLSISVNFSSLTSNSQ